MEDFDVSENEELARECRDAETIKECPKGTDFLGVVAEDDFSF